MNVFTKISLLTAIVALACGCQSMTQPQTCPPGSSALNGIGEDKSDGNASAKIETPDGGFKLDVVDEKVIPIKATAEVNASISRSMKTACLNEAIVKSIAASPERWVFKLKSDGSYELSAK
ncbi:hypothetical protein [Massilia sp. CCM 8734]|uniref:hypothetical protein n=1 Tax=Massilia sp. CCM 8734 TaxID=2609283 RepID=UPI0014204AFE|nr:hypothetical protein [Massilia sp. CCM 8734]NHZ95273.1 hypothetical protein [Massilia sp. CCM 8734]